MCRMRVRTPVALLRSLSGKIPLGKVLSIKVPIRKKSRNLSYAPRIYLPTPLHEKDVAQGQYFNWSIAVTCQSFPSLRLVAMPKLKSHICPSFYPLLEGE